MSGKRSPVVGEDVPHFFSMFGLRSRNHLANSPYSFSPYTMIGSRARHLLYWHYLYPRYPFVGEMRLSPEAGLDVSVHYSSDANMQDTSSTAEVRRTPPDSRFHAAFSARNDYPGWAKGVVRIRPKVAVLGEGTGAEPASSTGQASVAAASALDALGGFVSAETRLDNAFEDPAVKLGVSARGEHASVEVYSGLTHYPMVGGYNVIRANNFVAGVEYAYEPREKLRKYKNSPFSFDVAAAYTNTPALAPEDLDEQDPSFELAVRTKRNRRQVLLSFFQHVYFPSILRAGKYNHVLMGGEFEHNRKDTSNAHDEHVVNNLLTVSASWQIGSSAALRVKADTKGDVKGTYGFAFGVLPYVTVLLQTCANVYNGNPKFGFKMIMEDEGQDLDHPRKSNRTSIRNAGEAVPAAPPAEDEATRRRRTARPPPPTYRISR